MHNPKRGLGKLGIVEGAIFALLGLLIAFTFSGAYGRFQIRITEILEEADAINTAYLRLDLLTPAYQRTLREDFREYVHHRSNLYKGVNIYDFKLVEGRLEDIRQIQTNIWHHAIAALKETNNSSATDLVLPALNNMFDIANTQFAMTKVHPPFAIFALLVTLSLLSTFIMGCSAAKMKLKHHVHILSYILVTSIMLYVILDLELPRVGLIRVTAFDNIFFDIEKNMK